ncbi:hypothetical protein K523DRAFT_420722 [Schizophyllum commune Tattone D]|nr:hypothetical protein K523DRAFT_420722 [Schizophyllum commune Tattone D]
MRGAAILSPPTLPADPHGDGVVPVETPIDVSLPNGEDAPDSALTTVLQASARVCLRTPRWLTSSTLPAAALATARRAGRDALLDEASPDHAIYLALYKWRDATARAADEGVGTILPNSALLLIADRWRNLIAQGNNEPTPLALATPTPLGLAAPHAALASLVAPAALSPAVRLRAAEVVGVVLGAVRGYAAKQVDAAKEDAAKQVDAAKEDAAKAKEGNEAARKAGDEEKGEKGEIEEKGEKGEIEEKGANAKTTSAIKTTPTPTSASLFGRRPAVLTPSTSVAASSSLFGGALGTRAASSSLLGGSAAPSATTPTTMTTASAAPASTTSTAPIPAASRSALFGGTLRNAASSTKVLSPTVAGAPSPTVAAAPSPTVAATPSLASIAARVHASFGVMPAVPSSSSAPAFDADTSCASTAEHAFVPAGQRSTASVTVFSSVKKGTGLTEAERKALAEKDEGEDDAMDDGEDDAVDEDTDSSGSDSNKVPAKSGSKKSDKDDKKSKKDKKSKETSKAAPSVAADAIVAGAGARQKKRKRTKGPALDLSGEAGDAAGGAASSSTSRANAQGAPITFPSADAPFDYASVPNILDAPGPSSTPTTERPRKKKRRVEEKGPHFRAPAPAPAEVRGVKVNLAHTFGK